MHDFKPAPSPDGETSVREALEHIPLVAMSPEQLGRLSDLQQRHPDTGIEVNRGPCGSVEATVTTEDYPPERHIFGRDADDMLARVTDAIEPDPDG
jgi:hypothetical protein